MKKKIRSVFFRLYIRLTEKRYKRIKYLLQTKNSSDTLVVCFSGFGNGGKAKYNYINTLRTVHAKKLFILDNFGYNKQGSYYLGENGEWFLPDMITGLIKQVVADQRIKQVVMIGSSKGGSAALFYGTKLNADACIIGAPQYLIGDYLNIERHLPILEGIMGDTSSTSIQKLNSFMHDCLFSASENKPKVYIHYSPMEHTYSEHIAYMVRDLKQCGYEIEEDSNYEYAEHGDVAKHFPKYLKKIFAEIIR